MTGDRYRDWDASYLLDALSRTERAEYEEHLASCEACRNGVAELAGMSALLGRAHPADVAGLLDPVPPDVPPGVLSRMSELAESPAPGRTTRPRRPRWMTAAVLGVVAAILVAAAVVVGATVFAPRPPQPAVVATAAADPDSPISASIALYPEPWGTRIEMKCGYEATGRWAGRAGQHWTYTMVVISADAEATQIATWTVAAGDTAHPAGTTNLSLDRIRAVEIRAASGAVLVTIPVR